jgi:hypothetical protein
VERWLIGERDAFTFNLNTREQPAYNQLTVLGEGLHLTLFDSAGGLVAEGQTAVDPDGVMIETLSLSGVLADSDYVVLVERTDIDETIQGLLLPAVQFQLSWQ